MANLGNIIPGPQKIITTGVVVLIILAIVNNVQFLRDLVRTR